MVGDTTHDLSMANNAEVHALAVSYGAHSKSELIELRPKAIVDKPKDVFDWILRNKIIGKSHDLIEAGDGIRFMIRQKNGVDRSAFAIRYCSKVYGYINECAHIPVELDWMEGHFLIATKKI